MLGVLGVPPSSFAAVGKKDADGDTEEKLPAQGKACLTEVRPIKEDGCRWQPSSLMNLFLLLRRDLDMQLIQLLLPVPAK